MRIDQLGGPAAPPGPRIRRRQDGFAVSDDAPPQEHAAAAPLGAATDILGAASASQAAPMSAAEQDRQAAQHGDAMLKTLSRLQLAALGAPDEDAASCLAALAGSLQQASDPGLQAVLQGIAARAAIEAARSG